MSYVLLERSLTDADGDRLVAILDRLDAEPDTPPAVRELVALVRKLSEDHQDHALLLETVLEHSTAVENELSERNERITGLLDNMRRYLAPQLFERIVGGSIQADTTSYKRRRLTVFFSDLVGFTAMADQVEAEVLSDVLNTYLDRMAEIATRSGGTIDKFIGDAVMVFFGDRDDVSAESEALACVRMALEMQVAMLELVQVWRQKGIDRPLSARMGINTGHCTVGNFGSAQRMDYTIVGSTVNVASRLEGLAEPGGIVISGSTYHLVKDAVECTHRGAVSVKGVHAPVETYDVVGLRGDEASAEGMTTTDDGGFELRALAFSPEQTSDLQRAELRKLLERALGLLDAPEG